MIFTLLNIQDKVKFGVIFTLLTERRLSMAKFFRNELGLILGILAAKNFQGKIWAWRPPGYSIQNDYKYDDYIISSSESRYGTGRGGYYADENGDYGRPGLGDELFEAPDVAMAGKGGELNKGGSGLYDGLFGIQKGVYTNSYTVSAGGGGGWYGGGWSFIGGGGGGGSSFVLSDLGWNKLAQVNKYKIINYYLSLLPKEIRDTMTEEEAWEYIRSFFGDWYDKRKSVTSRYPWLYGLNHRNKYALEMLGSTVMADYRAKLDNNGAVLVSKPNEIITYEKSADNPDGFKNLDLEFLYTGKTQELTIKVDGLYHIIAYGACGGDRYGGGPNTPLSFNGAEPVDWYLGGYGGCASGLFYFKAGTKLYVNVGGSGLKYKYRFKNASRGLGYCTGGGSESNVCYNNSEPASRIIVAGGGGGVYAKPGDNDDQDKTPKDIKPPKEYDIIDVPSDEEGNPVEEEETDELKNMRFMVNDQSIVHVLVKSYNQMAVPDFAKTSCSIYIDDGTEGEMHQTVTPGGGEWVYEFQFHLDKVYPPNTPTHEVTIDAVIKTNFYSVLAKDGTTVWVTTKYALSDSESPKPTLFIDNKDQLEINDYVEVEILKKRELAIYVEDTLGIDDFYDWLIKQKGAMNLHLYDLIDLRDFYEKTVIKTSETSSLVSEEQEIADELTVSLVHLEYVYSDICDELNMEDYVELFIPAHFLITGHVNDDSFGSISGLGDYLEETYCTLTANINDGYKVKGWYINNQLVSEANTYTFKVVSSVDVYLVLELINPGDLPVPLDGQTDMFEALFNKNKEYSSNTTIWHNLLETYPEIVVNEDGIVSGSLTDSFDGMNQAADKWPNKI